MRPSSSKGTGLGRLILGVSVVALVASGCAVTRVSVSSTGGEGNQASSVMGVTDDGRYSLFISEADNLVPGDTNGARDLFRHDATTGATIRVDVAPNGDQLADGTAGGAFSADGRYAVFTTAAALDPADTNGTGDAYVRDLVANTITWASQPPPAGLPSGGASEVAISGDGRYVSFLWRGFTTLPVSPTALYRRDRQTGTTTKLSETQYILGMRAATDGHHFMLQPTCLQGGCFPVPILIDTDGSAAGWPTLSFANCSFQHVGAISATGRYLAWNSAGGTGRPCLTPGNYLVDRATGVATPLGLGGDIVGISRDATAIVYTGDGSALPGGTLGRQDLYVRDLVHHTDARLNTTGAGAEANSDVYFAVVSDLGHVVGFVSDASDLVQNDHNGVNDVFVRPIGVSAAP